MRRLIRDGRKKAIRESEDRLRGWFAARSQKHEPTLQTCNEADVANSGSVTNERVDSIKSHRGQSSKTSSTSGPIRSLSTRRKSNLRQDAVTHVQSSLIAIV